MKIFVFELLVIGLLSVPLHADTPGTTAGNGPLVGDWPAERAARLPVSLRDVRLEGFLGRHVDANGQSLLAGLGSAIPAAFDAISRGEAPPAACRRLATDSDFFKWFEGACYAVAYDPSLTDLRAALDRYARIFVRMQEPDGFLGTRLSPQAPFDREVRHDLYVAGHFIEAAVAHHKATGQTELLDAARRLADFYIRAYEQKHPYFELVGRGEHPEIELALNRLYRATGEQKYLDFATAITRMSKLGSKVTDVHAGASKLHAVRLCYLLSGAAELYLNSGDESWRRDLPSVWHDIASVRMYLTGGIGYNERVPDNAFDLPHFLQKNPHRDIAETCASVSLMMFSWRMHGLTGEARYYDVMERILYNHYLGALSADHLANFYYNPLTRIGDLTGRTDHAGHPVRRTRLPEIHSTACCMPNAWRFFGQLPEYMCSRQGDDLFINLYSSGTVKHTLKDGTAVKVAVETAYPHQGQIRVRVEAAKPVRFGLHLRKPAWLDGPGPFADGHERSGIEPGEYLSYQREWRPGEEVQVEFPMKPAVVIGRGKVEDEAGKVAFSRGPLVYCLEKQDAAGLDLACLKVILDENNPAGSVREEYWPEQGFHVLKVKAIACTGAGETHADGDGVKETGAAREITLVPFYYRANRDADTRWTTYLPYH